MDRREFLKTAGLVPLALLVPGIPGLEVIPRLFADPPEGAGPHWDRILVLVELAGGNDGLNTVVPFSDDRYYSLRPTLGVKKNNVIPLSERLGFNSMLEPLTASWKDKDLALVLGVGYQKPNRSHFRSIEIWETGSDSNQYLQQGWLARLLETSHPPADLAAEGVVLGPGDAGPLGGGKARDPAGTASSSSSNSPAATTASTPSSRSPTTATIPSAPPWA